VRNCDFRLLISCYSPQTLCTKSFQIGDVIKRYLKHCVNGDFSFLWDSQKFDPPQQLETPDPIQIKFGMVDYVGEGTRRTNFHANPPEGSSLQIGEIYTQKFL